MKQQQKDEIDKLADQLESLAEDNDLLAGLEELDKKEKLEIEKVKKESSKNINVEQGQGSTIKKDDEDSGNSSYGIIGVVAALAIAGGIYAYRQSIRR